MNSCKLVDFKVKCWMVEGYLQERIHGLHALKIKVHIQASMPMEQEISGCIRSHDVLWVRLVGVEEPIPKQQFYVPNNSSAFGMSYAKLCIGLWAQIVCRMARSGHQNYAIKVLPAGKQAKCFINLNRCFHELFCGCVHQILNYEADGVVGDS